MEMEVEYKLLDERQHLKEVLTQLLEEDITDLNLYRRVYARFQVCNKLLIFYRKKYRKAI